MAGANEVDFFSSLPVETRGGEVQRCAAPLCDHWHNLFFIFYSGTKAFEGPRSSLANKHHGIVIYIYALKTTRWRK